MSFKMEELYIDSTLMSLSLLLVVGYHAHLWQCLKKKPEKTTWGIQREGRRAWLELALQLEGGSMQVVQILRNNLMIIILRASISIAVSSSVAALTNNAYKTQQLFRSGTQSSAANSGLFAVKYAAAFVVSVSSFLFSSFGVGFLIDTCMLVSTATASTHIQRLVDTGFALAFIGNRLMWLSFALLLWSLGPIPVALCSFASVKVGNVDALHLILVVYSIMIKLVIVGHWPEVTRLSP
ncbi:uncharacterized protein LOC111441778 [Cucurbita moschata]|uniref:Uncharacterized protein LOC111441778 n=2 Tax=Cucurbita TaxID=3660 RepID=A0A6J1F3D7_CUCMO